jgi:predicted ATPase/class 3 adenylate cyclase
MAALPTGTVTFLFTDIEGSTALLQRLGDRRYAEVLAEHQRLLRDAFAEGNGQEIDTQGDAFLVAFPRARDAVATAVAAQQALVKHPWPDGASLRVRMGLHTGEPVSEAGGYVGLDLHRAARICSAGHGGQILLSRTVGDLSAAELPPGVSLRDLGTHRLKDLKEPTHLFQVVHPDLPSDFAPLRSLDVLPNNLPRQLTSFIGREKEMAEVKRLLLTAYLVTLTGFGGAGKTRLALQAAAEVVEDYPEGVWLAELAPIADPFLVPKTVASALNVREQPGRDMTETMIAVLRHKALLLVLDNCEHLVAACRDLAAALLRACPKVRILATSREGLGVPGETLWRVPSLSAPKDISHLPATKELVLYDAVRLFADRAVATAPGFTVTSENAPAVAQVCQRLDGIPLAIELAAARVKVLAVEQIVARLDDRFRLLTGGSRTLLPRQQTLRATLDWSYGLLSDQEQTVLRRLSVFAEGWTLEAAEAVCAGDGVEASQVLDLLTQLVDKSLVSMEARKEARYRLLETVRQYGLEKLRESGTEDNVLRHHRDFFLAFAEDTASHMIGPEAASYLRTLEGEHDNVRAAFTWCLRTGDIEAAARLAVALREFFQIRGHLKEGWEWLTDLLARDEELSPTLRGQVKYSAVSLLFTMGDFRKAMVLGQETLALLRQLGDIRGIARCTNRVGSGHMAMGDYTRAAECLEESMRLYRELGEEMLYADSLRQRGHVEARKGDYDRATAMLEDAIIRFRSVEGKMVPRMRSDTSAWSSCTKASSSKQRPFSRRPSPSSKTMGTKRALPTR